MDEFLGVETLTIELLLVASLVAIAVRRLRLPYTIALVLVGLLITFQQPVAIDLTPEIILALFVPPLVFEAAFHVQFRRLREALLPIVVLAVPGVLLTTLIVGVIVSWGLGIALSSGLVFGALIAATDPVAVVALFRQLGAPKQLTVLVEGESLFNDGTAIVVFSLMVGVAVGSTPTDQSAASSVLVGAVDFMRVSVGGIAVGAGLGWLVAQLIARLDDYLIETTLTMVLAFGAYLVAERLHVSGVLAVVAAGMINGNIGPQGMSPTTRIVLFNFWEYLAFVANSLVFLLIGIEVNIPHLANNLMLVSVAVLAVVVSRILVVYGLTWLANRGRTRIPGPYKHVLVWGGLRGAISLALVLSLPATFADREVLSIMAFGVVLFTLLVQGTTMNFVLRRLGLITQDKTKQEYERRHAHLRSARAAYERLQQLHASGILSATAWDELRHELEQEMTQAREAQTALLQAHPALRHEEIDDARREGLRARRAMLTSLLNTGAISEHVYEELVAAIDASLVGEAMDDAAEEQGGVTPHPVESPP